MAKEKTDVAKVEEHKLPAMIPDLKDLREVYETNFSEGETPAFEILKVPTGGGLQWSIPSDEEDPESAKEIVGAILERYVCRAYWSGEYSGGNTPPDCSSLDGVTGTKFGKCAECEFSQWNTGKDGRGQACKRMERVFVLRSGGQSWLPYVLSLPPTSAPEKGGYEGSLRTYKTKMLGRVKKLHEIWSRIKLVQDKSSDGKYTYSKVVFFYAGDLNENEKKLTNALKNVLGGAMRQKPIETDEYHTEDAQPETRGAEQRDSSGETDPWDRT